MDRSDWPHGGMGNLPLRNHKLAMQDNQWPQATDLPHFRTTVDRYAHALEQLDKSMLPSFARALEMPADYFDEAFQQPSYRLRMTHYPATNDGTTNEGAIGINPHVDTSFCTILTQDRPDLAIYSERRQAWIAVPVLSDAFVVNTGELLRQWTNDRFLSTQHFAINNTGRASCYSIPMFFNANSDYVMRCVTSCCSEDNSPKYAPVSYSESQAVAQGK